MLKLYPLHRWTRPRPYKWAYYGTSIRWDGERLHVSRMRS